MGGFTPTEEQQAIIAGGREGDNLVVFAGAGTGKTTTLKLMSDVMPGRGLYLAYNKALQLEAATKFPRHVECRTAHSLAYGAVGSRFKNRLAAPAQPARELARILGIRYELRFDSDTVLKPVTLARLTRETVDRFCMSADADIQPWHVAYQPGIDPPQWKDMLAEAVLPAARKMWGNLQTDDRQGRFFPKDPASFRDWARFSHGHYLKMWQLTRPQMSYDFVLFDEAQDANPLIASVVQDQRNSQLIAVGDTNQQLYAWNGAVDALDDWPAETRLMLSESFRFGPEIADEANKWLRLLDSPMRITGRGAPGTVGETPGWANAVLCRTNAGAMSQAMDALADNMRTAIAGGGDAIKALANAALDLQQGRGTTHPELVVFNDWAEVQDYAEHESAAGSLKTLVDLIDDHGPDAILDAVERLVPDKPSRYERGRFRAPEVVVSTAHKSKGLEWNDVQISDDFREPGTDDNGQPKPVSRSDAMLAYVSVTRAQQRLDLGGLSWINSRPELASRGQAAGVA